MDNFKNVSGLRLSDKIKAIGENNSLSKREQIVRGVSDALDEGILKKGDMLPSINQMVEDIGFARKTVVRGYNSLKEIGLIDSLPQKGYFVVSERTEISTKVVLLFYELGQIQENFYATLKSCLGKNYVVDVFFHHNDLVLFESLMDRIQGKYGKYVIAPIEHKNVLPFLKSLPPQKLLIVDRYIELGNKYSYIVQEFENSIFNGLMAIFAMDVKYKELVFFHDNNPIIPMGIVKAVQKFADQKKVDVSIAKKYEPENLKKNCLYFVLSDNLLWKILGDCKTKGLEVGKDIGILGHNDDAVKEIIVDGISTLAADFHLMAKFAADHIKTGKTIQTIMPINLINRNSI